jgi:CelD/BcsL family acetyltransferase involved in cellulose biosynthesis
MNPQTWSEVATAESCTSAHAFASIRTDWNALAAGSASEPFLRHEYIGAFLQNFLPEAPLRVAMLREASGRLIAALPLVLGVCSILGFRARALISPTNVHSLRFDLLAEEAGADDADADVAGATFLEYLLKDDRWEVLMLADVPQGGRAWGVLRAARLRGLPAGAWEAQRSPYIELGSSHPELMAGLRTKFRANLRRRRKRLSEVGDVTVERLSGEALNEGHLEEALALESRGWKGQQGSAAGLSPQAHGFHRDLFREPAHHQRLVLYRLQVSGKTIAFHYGIDLNRVFSLVMTSYDESFAEFSPGHLLTEEVLKDCAARGITRFDFLGCDLPWKLEWTSLIRPHHWLFIFRDSLHGRWLHRIKFVWVAAARQLLTKTRMRLSAFRASSGQSRS